MSGDGMRRLHEINDGITHAFGVASVMCEGYENGGGFEESRMEALAQLLKGYLLQLTNDLHDVISRDSDPQALPAPVVAAKPKRKKVKR